MALEFIATGPGVGYWMYKIKSLEHAKEVLKQYSDIMTPKAVKMYLVGNPSQRQWIIMAAKNWNYANNRRWIGLQTEYDANIGWLSRA